MAKLASTQTQNEPVQFVSCDLEITVSPSATIAVFHAIVDGEEYAWTGTAKRFPGDKFVPRIGRRLAIGRALQSAGRQLERQGNGFVKNMDHNREASAKAKEKRQAMENAGVNVHRIPSRRTRRTSN